MTAEQNQLDLIGNSRLGPIDEDLTRRALDELFQLGSFCTRPRPPASGNPRKPWLEDSQNMVNRLV